MKFKEFLLGNLCEIKSSKRIYAKEYQKFGIPFYRSKEIIQKANNENLSTELYISEERYKEIKEKFGSPKNGDILLTSVGTLGISYLVRDEEFYFKDGNLTWFSNFSNELHNEFLYYWFNSQIGKNEINRITIGSTQKALTIVNLKTLRISLPTRKNQIKIVYLLKSLNEKLKNNLRIISNLEELGIELFKHWFIDFEFPNEEGKPYKSSGGEMVESVMGKIPINWSISKIETIAQFKNGKKITSDDRNETGIYKIFGSNGVIGYTNKTLYSAPSLVIGRVGANCGSMELSLDPCWISDNAIMCAPKNMIYYNFLYILLKKIKLKERAGGSAQPLINQSILKGLKFILPSESLVKKFHSIAYKNTQLTENLKKENEKLAEIRDTLLPKLLSGEIEIPDNLEV